MNHYKRIRELLSKSFTLAFCILTGVQFNLFSPAASAISCSQALLEQAAVAKISRHWGNGNDDFISGKNNFPQPEMTQKTPDLEVKDQCSIGVCWLQSKSSAIERKINFENEGKSTEQIAINRDAMIYHFLLYRALKFADSLDQTTKISLIGVGGSLTAFKEIFTEEFGMLPDGAWKVKNHFYRSRKVVNLVLTELNLLAIKLKSQIGRGNMDYDQAKVEIEKFLLHYFQAERPPDTFTWNGKEWTAQEWMLYVQAQYLKKTKGPLVEVLVLPVTRTPQEWKIAHQIMIRAIELQLKESKHPIVAQFRWLDAYINSQTGTMSVEHFSNSGVASFDRAVVAMLGKDQANHQVIITDFGYDRFGQLVFKIQNSHGAKWGQNGYGFVYKSYWRPYLFGAEVEDYYYQKAFQEFNP